MIRHIDELPTKRETNKKFRKIDGMGIKIYREIKKLGGKDYGVGWGSQINLPCEFYKTEDGKLVEVYGVKQYGYPTSAYVEI